MWRKLAKQPGNEAIERRPQQQRPRRQLQNGLGSGVLTGCEEQLPCLPARNGNYRHNSLNFLHFSSPLGARSLVDNVWDDLEFFGLYWENMLPRWDGQGNVWIPHPFVSVI